MGMIMITAAVYQEFETLWKRPNIFDKNLTYGAAFAQYTKCTKEDPASSFLHNSAYPAVKAWIEERVNADTKIQTEQASSNTSKPPSQ